MTGTEYFAKLLELEANIHMIKAHNLLKDKDRELQHLIHLKNTVNEIFDTCINESQTKMYLAK